ncbi:MAG: hypothetical protein ACI9R8_002029 [Candidatus Paceibacteria bacterium]|jgi:hypothetical protein
MASQTTTQSLEGAGVFQPSRAPDMELVGYLHRWCIKPRGRDENQYLHHILAPDYPVLHDHPWTFKSIILHGGYTEMTPTGLVERQAGDVYEKKADDLHYISAVLPDTWTLIFTGPTTRDWGFLSDGQWISHSDFTERRIKLITRNGYSGN